MSWRGILKRTFLLRFLLTSQLINAYRMDLDCPMLNCGKSVALQSSRKQTFEMRARDSVLSSDIALGKKTPKRNYN